MAKLHKQSSRSLKSDGGSPGKKPGFFHKILGLKSRSNSVSSHTPDTRSRNSVSYSTGSTSSSLAKITGNGSFLAAENPTSMTPSILVDQHGITDILDRDISMLESSESRSGVFRTKSKLGNLDVAVHPKKNALKKNLFRRSSETVVQESGHNSYIDDDSDNIYDEDINSSVDNASFGSSVSHTNSSISLLSVDEKINVQMEADDDRTWSGLSYEALLFPRYIKGNRRSKNSPRQFKRLFLAQELHTSLKPTKPGDPLTLNGTGMMTNSDDILSETSSKNGPENGTGAASDTTPDAGGDPTLSEGEQHEVFVMKFSNDGNYLATAGRDAVVRIWKVISSPLGRLEYKAEQHENEPDEPQTHRKGKSRRRKLFSSAPVFRERPIREFKGHTKGVLTLDWSKNNFLVSGSMDKTVRLWHVDRLECLEVFEHEDFVTTVRFHPTDDRFFLSGSLDNEVRLWSILEFNVAYSRNLGNDVLITAAEFTPDGTYCLVGGFNGCVFALETKGLHVSNTFVIKTRNFVNFHARSYKITGIEIFDNGRAKNPEDALASYNILVSTNDSKVRLISSSLKTLITRFKGLSNQGSSIAASMSEDRKFVVSGSEDSWVYIWENSNSIVTNKVKLAIREILSDTVKNQKGEKQLNSFIRGAKSLVGNKVVKKLKLPKLIESGGESYVANENSSYFAFHAHGSRVNCAVFAPSSTQKLLQVSDDIIFDLVRRAKNCTEASKHNHMNFDVDSLKIEDGYIIVTTDNKGLIRVFRQDVAYPVRNVLRQMLRNTANDVGAILKANQCRPSRNLSPSILRLKGKNGSSASLSIRDDHGPVPARQSSIREKVNPFSRSDSKIKVDRSMSPQGTPTTLHDSSFHFQQLSNDALHSTFQNLRLDPAGRNRGRAMH